MARSLIALLLMFLAGAANAQTPELNPDHPDTYVVQANDTLWGIAQRFLRDPWRWQEILEANPQVADPHQLRPGDVLQLVNRGGEPRLALQRGGASKLSPEIRVSELPPAIPTIPLEAVRPFLVGGRVVGKGELESAAYVLRSTGEHLIAGAGDRVFVRGPALQEDARFQVFRAGETYVDPDTKESLGYAAVHVGDGVIEHAGDPATLLLQSTTREALPGDRLLPTVDEEVRMEFLPRAPKGSVEGRILAVYDGVTQVGQNQVVVLNRGQRDGLLVGHVLRVWQEGKHISDPVAAKSPQPVQLPEKQAGTVMVFRIFEKVSYGLVLGATEAIHVNDRVRDV
jgi:LysM repeat protein